MTRKKSIKTEEQEEFEVDEPSEVDDGANDDSSQNENSRGGRGRRTSTRPRVPKKPYRGDDSSGEEEEEEEDEEMDSEEEERPKKKSKPGPKGRSGRNSKGKPPQKKIKREKDEEEEEETEEEDDDEDDESDGDAEDTPPEFRSGCFVVLKTDVDGGENNFPLWRIDGKSLLQKYDKMIHRGETLFKSTTIYAGWSKAVIDTYYPIKIEYKKVEGHDSVVKFDPDNIQREPVAAVVIKKEDGADGDDGEAVKDSANNAGEGKIEVEG